MKVSLNAENALPPPPFSSSPLHLSPWITGLTPEPVAAPSTAPGSGALAAVALAAVAVALAALEIDSAGRDEFLQAANTARPATRRRNVISRQYVTVCARANGPPAPDPWGEWSPE